MARMTKHVLATLAGMSMWHCSLVLDEPRPYPAPNPDSAIVVSNLDAGMGMSQQGLLHDTQSVDGVYMAVSMNRSPTVPGAGILGRSTLDWLCGVTVFEDDAFCWWLGTFNE